MPDNSQKLQLIRQIRQSGYPGSVTEVFQAYDQGQDLIGQWVQQQQQQQQGPQGPQGPLPPQAQGPSVPPMPPPMNRPDGRVRQPNINQPLSNDQGHLVQSQTPSNVGIQDLPTGPAQGQMIQAREGGVRENNDIGDSIIYPPGDDEWRIKPYNKEIIIDLRRKLEKMGIYNVPNEDLQKAYEWEMKKKQKEKNVDLNKPSFVKEGGVRQYKNGGGDDDEEKEKIDKTTKIYGFQNTSPSEISGSNIHSRIISELTEDPLSGALVPTPTLEQYIEPYTIPTTSTITGGVIDNTLLSLDKSKIDIKSKTLLGNFMKNKLTGENIFSVPILEQSLSAAKKFGDANLEATIKRELLNAGGGTKYNIKGTHKGKKSFTELELEHEPNALTRALLIHNRNFGANTLGFNIGYSGGSGQFGESGFTGGLQYTRKFEDGGPREYENEGFSVFEDVTKNEYKPHFEKESISGKFNTNYQESQNYQRIKKSRIGSRINADGSISSHLLADNGKDEAWPTLFQNEDGSWYQLSGKQAYQEAKRKDEIYKFDSKTELIRFARQGDWKKSVLETKYRSGGVKKSKSYIRKYHPGGVNEGTHPDHHPELSGANEPLDEELEVLSDDYFNYYQNMVLPYGPAGTTATNVDYMDQDMYNNMVTKYGSEVANQMFLNKKTNTAGLPAGTAATISSIGYDPYTGNINTMDALNKKYYVGKENQQTVPQGYDFNTYDPNFIGGNVVGGEASLSKTDPLAYEQYKGDWTTWLDQDPSTYRFTNRGVNFWTGDGGTPQWTLNSGDMSGLTQNEIIQYSNALKYNSRYMGGSQIAGYNTRQGIPIRNENYMGGNLLDYYSQIDKFQKGQMRTSVQNAQNQFISGVGDLAYDFATAPYRAGKWAWNNPKEAGLLGLDILAGVATIVPEPITSAVGASWLAGRGTYKLSTQEAPIGFNLETLGNASYFIPGGGTYGGAVRTGLQTGVRTGLNTARTAFPRTYNTISNTVRSSAGRTKNMFTTMPTVKSNAITKTFNYNLQSAQQGFNTAKNAITGNLSYIPKTQIGKNILGKSTTSNVKHLTVNPISGNISSKFVAHPSFQHNLLSRTLSGVSGTGQGLYRTSKMLGQMYSGIKLGEYGYDAITNPKKTFTLDRTMDLGTDLTNVFAGHLTGASDLTKSALYYGQGKKEKAYSELAGVFNPIKPITNYWKLIQKAKSLPMFSQTGTSPILTPDYTKSSQISQYATKTP